MSRRRRANEDTEDGFLKRWSRRKAEAEEFGPLADEQASADPGEEVEHAEPRGPHPGETGPGAAAESGERILTDEDMPDIETIDETTDMSGFFSPGVSESLRAQALRRLFRLPKFNVLDGLDDYNEDYRSFAALGDVVTSDMRRVAGDLPESERPADHRTQKRADARKRRDEDAGQLDEARTATGQPEAAGSPDPDQGEPERVDAENPEQPEAEA